MRLTKMDMDIRMAIGRMQIQTARMSNQISQEVSVSFARRRRHHNCRNLNQQIRAPSREGVVAKIQQLMYMSILKFSIFQVANFRLRGRPLHRSSVAFPVLVAVLVSSSFSLSCYKSYCAGSCLSLRLLCHL